MGVVGQLGDIPFEVSQDKVMSFNSFSRTDSPRISEINYINKRPGTQYNGTARSTGSFNLPLFTSLGVDVKEACHTLRTYAKKGTVLKFILGGSSVFYKDVRITSLSTDYTAWSNGEPIAATAAVSVEEV
jgi:phage protein U